MTNPSEIVTYTLEEKNIPISQVDYRLLACLPYACFSVCNISLFNRKIPPVILPRVLKHSAVSLKFYVAFINRETALGCFFLHLHIKIKIIFFSLKLFLAIRCVKSDITKNTCCVNFRSKYPSLRLKSFKFL